MIEPYTEIGVQILIVFVGGDAFQVTSLGGRQWGISLALGVVSLPLGVVIRLLPNAPFERLFRRLRLLPRPDILPRHQWSPAAQKVKDALRTFTHFRGARRSRALVLRRRYSKTSVEETPQMFVLIHV
jgi:P-type Ca2+ transporter type 2C